MSKDLFTHLILKSFRDELTDEERRQLENWIAEDDANRQLVERLRKAWDHADHYKSDFESDLEEGWQAVQARIAKRDQPVKRTSPSPRIIPVWRSPAVRIAASLVLLVGMAWAVFQFIGTGTTGPAYVEVSTGADEKLALELPDGSTVWLNEASTLRYPEGFGQRSVELDGEAQFSVQHDAQKPFAVTAGGTKTTVLGTVFNVSAYADAATVDVSLIEGRVAFSLIDEAEQLLLDPGQTATFDKAVGTLAKAETASPNFNAWQTGQLVFEQQPVETVAADIADYFGKPVVMINQSGGDCSFTGTFKEPSFEEILEVLSFTFDLNQSERNDTVYLAISRCE